MMQKGNEKKMTLASSAFYQIKVQGWLDESWSDRLAGMRININLQDNEKPVATLSGRVSDQSELLGVLNNLYELRLPIMSVRIVDKNDTIDH
jgi:hypothetical protein